MRIRSNDSNGLFGQTKNLLAIFSKFFLYLSFFISSFLIGIFTV